MGSNVSDTGKFEVSWLDNKQQTRPTWKLCWNVIILDEFDGLYRLNMVDAATRKFLSDLGHSFFSPPKKVPASSFFLFSLLTECSSRTLFNFGEKSARAIPGSESPCSLFLGANPFSWEEKRDRQPCVRNTRSGTHVLRSAFWPC